MIKIMNSKMTTNSQVSTIEPLKKKRQTKQKARTGTESQKWRILGGSSVGRGAKRMGGKGKGIRSINSRYQIDRGRLRIA